MEILDMKKPLFIVGCPRSGTTFLYDLLLSSGKFALYQAESDVFFRIAPAFGDLKSWSNRRKLMDAWLESDYFRRSGLNAGELRARVLSECRNPGDFLRIVMESIARGQGVRRWADNTPFHVLYLAEIKKTIPNAQVVHIIRDGRDVAMSLSRMGWPYCFPWDTKHSLAISGLYWKWLVSQGRESGRKLGSDYLELRYEQLVAHPQETLATLSRFIGEDLCYRVIQKNAVGTVARPNSSFPYTGELSSVGRWKNLSHAEAVRLTTLLSPLLSELGYQTARISGAPFLTWRLNKWYRPYWWLRQRKIKQNPLSRFLVSRDRLKPGALDKVDRFWEEIRSGAPDACQTNSKKP
jgi:Sulfotransferase family